MRIEIDYYSDEAFEVRTYVPGDGDRHLASFNHDMHGWSGMSDARSLVVELAAALNVELVEIGERNV